MKLLLMLALTACAKTKAPPTAPAKPAPAATAPAAPAPIHADPTGDGAKACDTDFCGQPKPCDDPNGCI